MPAAFEVTIESPEIQSLNARIQRLAGSMSDMQPLMQSLAAELESQARRRISSEKAAPDGTAWPAWSDAYAATRHGGQSLLEARGGLLDSIVSEADADSAEAGSNLIYAPLHQEGGTSDMAPGPAAVPAREWLGISPENEAELQAVIDLWVEGRLGEFAR